MAQGTNAPPIRRLLVANRGEIARRVFRTASRLGIETVAVFSDPDRDGAHVRAADICLAIGGTSSAESYLDMDKILAAALRCGADAIHPGYGFLSESPAFAERVQGAGLVWVGPTVESIRAMAGKVEAKRLASAAGVPLVPGAELPAEAQAPELAAAAESVGFPLLVKASAGGGGKGMRLVESEVELADAVASACREAQASFGDPTVFLERYLRGAHHIEVQVFGDCLGNVVHLRERECSIQRRHQKIIEECPSPNAEPATLQGMYDAALALASAIGYVGAGTVEFLVSGTGAAQEFFFLEMNTRLQVEHPVTEAVLAPEIDLVEWQLLVAQGAALPLTQEEIRPRGNHAIEARLYAEDPGCDFMPSTGKLVAFDGHRRPGGEAGGAIREELGVETGDTVTPHYDPMIGKIIVAGSSRRLAAAGLAADLARRDIVGVTTNRDALVAILTSDDFLAGRTTTHFIDEHPDLLATRLDSSVRRRHLIAAAIAAAQFDADDQPWASLAPLGWRNVRAVPARSDWSFHEAGETCVMAVVTDWREPGVVATSVVPVDPSAGLTGTGEAGETVAFRVLGAPGEPDCARCRRAASGDPAAIELQIDGVLRRYRVGADGPSVWVNDGTHATAYHRVPRFVQHADQAGGAGPSAPVPGTVVAVDVVVGDQVVEGQTLVVLEAMKMEHKIAAPGDGRVEEVLVSAGQAVDAHELLVRVAPSEAAAQDEVGL